MVNLPSAEEEHRLEALYALAILDTAPEASFDRIVRLASVISDAPVAQISLIDRDRQWAKASAGSCAVAHINRSDSVCTYTIQQNEPLVIPDLSQDVRFANASKVAGPPYFRFYAGTPLSVKGGYNIGALCCLDYVPRILSPEKLEHLHDLAELTIEAMELRLIATIDALTTAMTRQAFTEAAQRDIDLAKRHTRPFSCVLLDIDHFKAVNDRYGHAAGDKVLRDIVATLKKQLRSSDYIGRIGGEEFAFILRETSAGGAMQVAERMRAEVQKLVFHFGYAQRHVTASFGVSSLDDSNCSLEELLMHADGALYRAKSQGRNRVETARNRHHTSDALLRTA